MENSWPYFNRAISFSGPIGIPFFNTTEASEVYKSAAKLLNCWHVISNKPDMNCLRQKSMKEIKDATVSGKGIILNTVGQVLGNDKVTTFGELYSPIVKD